MRGSTDPTPRSPLGEAVFHPFLFAAYPVLHLYSLNADQTDLQTVLPPLVLFPALAGLLWGLCRLVIGSARSAALMTSLAVLLFFSYGHVYYFAYSRLVRYESDAGSVHGGPLALETGLTWGLSASWLLLLALGIYGATRPREQALAATTRVLNGVAVVLITMPLVTLAVRGFLPSADREPRQESRAGNGPQDDNPVRPDIYYIVLDGYARADVLEERYSFDNSPFLDGLRRRGFAVYDRSWANYSWTFLSLSSTLNMKHVLSYSQLHGRGSTDRELAYREIRDNAVVRFLRSRGYRYVHLTSTWGATLHNPHADVEINCAAGIFRNELYRVIGETSWIKAWSSRIGFDLARCHLSNLESLAKLAPMEGPKFVFAHFLPPHHPYLFDRDGNVLRRATVSNQLELRKRLWRRKDEYLDQLVYMNRRIEGVVDAILAGSEEQPIIIIHSDHGPAVGQTASERQRARLATLSAAHLPGLDTEAVLPRDLSSVNLFVRLLNHYFAAGLELQPRRHYISPFERPYDLREVELP